MNINVWGPVYWDFLHAYSLIYKNNSVEDVSNFLTTFENYVPCIECREHYNKYIKTHVFDGSVPFDEYVLRLHNNVNRRLKKKEYAMKDVKKRFSKHDHMYVCKRMYYFNRGYEVLFALFIGFVITIMCVLVYFKMNVRPTLET
jgi:hypothetical protein